MHTYTQNESWTGNKQKLQISERLTALCSPNSRFTLALASLLFLKRLRRRAIVKMTATMIITHTKPLTREIMTKVSLWRVWRIFWIVDPGDVDDACCDVKSVVTNGTEPLMYGAVVTSLATVTLYECNVLLSLLAVLLVWRVVVCLWGIGVASWPRVVVVLTSKMMKKKIRRMSSQPRALTTNTK